MKLDWRQHPEAMYMTRLTLMEFPYGSISSTVYGRKRVGKTICIILKQMDIYRILYPDMSMEERFKKAMENTIYTIDEMIKKTEKAQRRYDDFQGGDNEKQYIRNAIDAEIPIPCWHIDDGGVGFNKYKYFTNRVMVEKLKDYMDTIGIVVTALDVSTPNIGGVLSFIREYEGYRIHIIKSATDFRRIAKIYKIVQLPSGTIRVGRPKSNPFKCHLPDDLYREYKKMRGRYLKENVAELKKYQKKLEDKNVKDPQLDQEVDDANETMVEMKEENII
jgi:hypothetical protein